MVIRARLLLAASAAIGVAMASSTAADTSKCKFVRFAELPIRPSQGLLVTDGAINGRKVGILIDTGAERSVALLSAAARLRLALEPAGGHAFFGVGGESPVRIARVDEIQIGGAVRKNWRVLAVGAHDFGQNISFILGYDYFRQADIEFDLAHNAVRLYHAKDCKVSLAYWAPAGASEVNIEPVDTDHPGIVLSVQINGQPVQAMLDSGAAGSVISKRQAEKLGVTPETPGVTASGGIFGFGKDRVDSWIGPFESFTVGDEIVRNPKIRFMDLTRFRVSVLGPVPTVWDIRPMLLGADFLRSHRVLVAHSQGKIYFSYVGGPVFPVPAPLRRPETARPDENARPDNSPPSQTPSEDLVNCVAGGERQWTYRSKCD